MKLNQLSVQLSTYPDDLFKQVPIKVISFLPSKGGCGNSCLALNYAHALAENEKKVLLLDANLSMPSIDIMLGEGVRMTLQDVLEGHCELEQVIHHLGHNIGLISGSTNQRFWSGISIHAYKELLVQALLSQPSWEYLVIDCAHGLTNESLLFVTNSNENIMIMNNEPASLSKAYSLIKTLYNATAVKKLHILSNMVFNSREGFKMYQQLDDLVSEQFDMALNYLGSLSFSWEVRDAIRNQKAFLTQYPEALASKQLIDLFEKIEDHMIESFL